MANIPNSSLKTWNDGDVIHATDYQQDRSILQTAINDNYTKLIAKYDKTDVDNLLNAMKGSGWTTETIKANHDLILGIQTTISNLQSQTTKLSSDGSNYTGAWYNMQPSQIATSTVNWYEKQWTATAGQTVFQLTGSDKLYTPNSETTWLMVGGVPQVVGQGYTETDNKTVTLAEGVDVGTIVEMRYFLNNAASETPITNMVGFQENVATPLADIVYQVPASNGTDDTAVLQAAFDYSSQNGIVARLKPNQTYIVTKQGIINIVGIVPSAYAYQYCLLIGANAHIDLNGSTIQVKAGQDASPIINKNPNLGVSPIDNNITIENGTIDSQYSLQSNSYYQAGLYISNANNLTLKNLNVINSNISGMYHLGLNNAYFENILIKNTQGGAFNFGNYYSGCPQDGRNNNCVIKDITVDTTTQGYFYPASNAAENMGNSYYVVGSNLSFYNVKDLNSYGGKYAYDFSSDIYYDSIYASGQQSVVKLQNDDGNLSNGAKNIHIKRIHSVGVGSQPFEIDQSQSVFIEHITIENPTGTGRIVYIDGDDLVINELFIKSATSSSAKPLYTKANSNLRIDHLKIDGFGGNLDIEGSRLILGDVIINRTDATQTGTVIGLASNVMIKCNYLEITTAGTVSNAITPGTGNDLTFMHLKINQNTANPMTGSTITLAAGTSTTINPINLIVNNYSRYLIPIVELIPINSTSRGITIQGVAPSNGQLKIYHSTAVGTEKFIMNVIKYVTTDVLPA